MANSCVPSWYSGAATLTCFSGILTSAWPLSRKTSVAADAAELSRLLMSTRRQDFGREVLGLNVTGTCRDVGSQRRVWVQAFAEG